MCREEEREREAKKLKEFLEDYDDERDDVKYYKGKELQHRLSARVREAEGDGRERADERTELDKLKRRVFQDRTDDDPNAQAQYDQMKKEQEDMYKPRLLIDVNLEQSQQREREEQRARDREEARREAREREARHRERFLQDRVTRELPAHAEPIDSDSSPEVPDADGIPPPEPPDDEELPPLHQNPSNPRSPTTPPEGNGYQHHHRRHRHHRRQSIENSRADSPGSGGDGRLAVERSSLSPGTPSPPDSPERHTPEYSTPHYSQTPTQATSPLEPNSPISISMNFKNPHPNLLQPVHNQQHDGTAGKKRKLDVRDVFNTGESDDDDDHKPRRHGRHHRHHHHRHHHKGSGGERSEGETELGSHPAHANPPNPDSHSDQTPTDDRKSKSSSRTDKDKDKDKDKESKDAAKSQEEKRRHIKSLIDKIPTQKEALFNFKLDTSQIDSSLMEKKIRPWINKKIIEYIGEPEPTLVDFICSKVLAGSSPQGILDDVQMVLDEEAEVFVVKMWRLLIYEVEAKKLGLIK